MYLKMGGWQLLIEKEVIDKENGLKAGAGSERRTAAAVGTRVELIAILESFNDAVIVLDSTGQIMKVNSAFEKMAGLLAIQCLGLRIKDIPELGDLADFMPGKFAHSEKSIKYLELPNGRQVLVSGNYVENNCDLTNGVIIMQDMKRLNRLITDIERSRDLSARLQSHQSNIKKANVQEDFIFQSQAMKRVVNLALRVAAVDSNVLVTGETGVGKEVLAKIIHKYSPRAGGPFIKINCGAIPGELLESELFGYEAGAFTGAQSSGKPGLIEMSDCGTLFLDEIGDIPLNLQVKLLRVLQEREIQRLGSTKTKKVDFRLVTATNRDLKEMVKQDKFREDLYYRLNVIPVEIPPLRQRKEDIVPLVVFFLNKLNKKCRLAKKLSPEVIQSLINYDWPGNIRELENTVERLVVTSETDIVSLTEMKETTEIIAEVPEQSASSSTVLSLMLIEKEKDILHKALERYKTTRKMAVALGISQSTVVKKLKKYGITKL